MQTFCVGYCLVIARVRAEKVGVGAVERMTKNQRFCLIFGKHPVKRFDFRRVQHPLAFHDFYKNFLQLEVEPLHRQPFTNDRLISLNLLSMRSSTIASSRCWRVVQALVNWGLRYIAFIWEGSINGISVE